MAGSKNDTIANFVALPLALCRKRRPGTRGRGRGTAREKEKVRGPELSRGSHCLARNYYLQYFENANQKSVIPCLHSHLLEHHSMAKEANVQLAIRQEKFIRDLKNALLRIENKTYGVCRVSGKLIQKERLKLVPHATLSIEAKKQQS